MRLSKIVGCKNIQDKVHYETIFLQILYFSNVRKNFKMREIYIL